MMLAIAFLVATQQTPAPVVAVKRDLHDSVTKLELSQLQSTRETVENVAKELPAGKPWPPLVVEWVDKLTAEGGKYWVRCIARATDLYLNTVASAEAVADAAMSDCDGIGLETKRASRLMLQGAESAAANDAVETAYAASHARVRRSVVARVLRSRMTQK